MGLKEWKAKDPLPRFESKLIEMGVLTEEKVRQIDDEIAKRIDEAIQFAEESPFPAPEDITDDVYTV